MNPDTKQTRDFLTTLNYLNITFGQPNVRKKVLGTFWQQTKELKKCLIGGIGWSEEKLLVYGLIIIATAVTVATS